MASLEIDDTIAAIASPPGPSQRGIVRVSGPDAVSCLTNCFSTNDGKSLLTRTTTSVIEGSLQLGTDLSLPGRLLLWPTHRSYTRQPSAEFHTIGSPPLLQLALSTLCQHNARIARPGEFTLRAFLSGRLDLTQAEAVLAVIDAKEESDLRISLEQLAGGLATPMTLIRDELIAILAELEAQLDFVEEDIEFISDDAMKKRLSAMEDQLDSIISQIANRHLSEASFTAVLTGLPNAGKSSLFNQLLGETTAIVTNIAGTTTDYVTGTMERSGMSIQLIDTAGLENTKPVAGNAASIKDAAQSHRIERIERANVRIHCVAANAPESALYDLADLCLQAPVNDVLVVTQADQPLHAHVESFLAATSDSVIRTSSRDGTGIDLLRDKLFQIANSSATGDSPIVDSTIRRTADSLEHAAKSVQLARQAASEGIGEELVAAEIRQALEHLGYVVGTIYTDDILDIVFGQFCIGK